MGATQKLCSLCVPEGQVQGRVAMNSVASSSVSDRTEMELEYIEQADSTGILWAPRCLNTSTMSKLRISFLFINKVPCRVCGREGEHGTKPLDMGQVP